MRRVVITGLGIVSPVGCGVEASWQALLAGAKRRAPHRGVRGRRSHLPDRLLRSARRQGRRQVQSRRLDGAEGAAQGRRLHHLRDGGGRAGDHRFRLHRRHAREAGARRRAHRLRHRRPAGHRRDGDPAARRRARAASARSSFPAASSISPPATCRSSTSSRARTTPSSPPARPARTPSAMRRASSRWATPTSWSPAAPKSPICRIARRRLRRLPRAVDRLQRSPDRGLAPLRQGPRRLRHGRGRRRRRARDAGACQGARRQDLRRGHRLRHVGRRLPHHRAGGERRRRLSAACARR